MTTLARFNSAALTSQSGLQVSANALVAVRRESDGNLASIFSDTAGLNGISQPGFVADALGRFSFCAAGLADGYRITVTDAASPGLSFTLRNVPVGSAAYRDVGDFWLRTDTQSPESNLLVNPNWLLDQINEGALYTVNGAAVLGPDGWSGSATGAGVFKLRTLTDPENASLKCLEITCTTVDASIAVTDNYYIFTAIEGYDCGDLGLGTANASSLTLKFKAKFSVTGTYGISVANSATNRSYVGEIVVASTSEAEYTVTLTLDGTGTWLHTNGVGLYLRICLSAGTNFRTTAGTWAANNMFTTSAQANFMSSTSNVAYIKRMMLTAGSVATKYSQNDVAKDLEKAQRYYEKSYDQGVVPGTVTASGELRVIDVGAFNPGSLINVQYKVKKRAVPTSITIHSATSTNTGVLRNYTTVADETSAVINSGMHGFSVYANVTGTAGHQKGCHYESLTRLS